MPSAAQSTPSSKKIHADPTKDFFVTMITRDISLQDCIFDLLDNSIDGARRALSQDIPETFSMFSIDIALGADYFQVTDNCGGIPLSDAIDYAFHFGRRPDAPPDVRGGIGLYGIGMKRAIFKIGRFGEVSTETTHDSYVVRVDVDTWERVAEWDFEYEDKPRTHIAGTTVRVSRLNPSTLTLFEDPAFGTSLLKAIARDYSFFISKGLKVSVGGNPAPSFKYQVRENSELAPATQVYEDEGVMVRIVAGLVDELPDEIPDELRPDKVDRYGWFVVCNDRVVLAADKSDQTIWGDDGFQVWHPQYNGFAGFVFFSSSDPRRLPWTTTKREVDRADPLYRRTLTRMKAITESFIDYTNHRKSDVESARNKEKADKRVDVYTIATPRSMLLPTIGKLVAEDTTTISYRKLRSAVQEIREHIGNPTISAKEIGSQTFDYYMKMELGKQ